MLSSPLFSLSKDDTASRENDYNKHLPSHNAHKRHILNISGDVTLSRFLPLTLQQLGVYEQLQRQQQHHQNNTGHQETVEARRQQADLPQRRPSPTARLQPVRPDGGEREGGGGAVRGALVTKINGGSCYGVTLKCNTTCGSDRQHPRPNQ